MLTENATASVTPCFCVSTSASVGSRDDFVGVGRETVDDFARGGLGNGGGGDNDKAGLKGKEKKVQSTRHDSLRGLRSEESGEPGQ